MRTAKDLRRFIAFPYAHYRGDPTWVPPLRMDVRKMLDRKNNPFFEHAEAEYFLATRDNRVVGRIAAIHNFAHNEHHDDGAGFFGFFETIDDQDVAQALLDRASDWVRDRGLQIMRGPASFSTNDECGIVVEGHEYPPTVLTPHTPPYYQRLLEAAGFEKAKDLLLYQSVNHTLPERLERAVDIVRRRNKITLRMIDMSRFDEEVELIKKVYNGAWEKNWGFIPMTDAEIDHMAKDLKPVVVPEAVVFAEKDGEVIGFAAALPDMNVALKKNPSGRLFPGILKILWAARKITRLRILLLGALPGYRRSGVDALMYHWIWTKLTAKGFTWGEGGWLLEDNAAITNGLAGIGFEPYKTLRLYDRAV